MARNSDGTDCLTTDLRLPLSDISDLIKRDRKTLMRDIRLGRFPSALQASGGRRGWTVAVQDLVDAGLLEPEALATVPDTLRGIRESEELQALRARVIELESRLEVSTALAEERQVTIEWLRDLIDRLHKGGAR